MLKKVQIFKALDVEIKKQKGPIPQKEAYRGHHSLKEELSQPGITIVGEVAGGNPLRGQVREAYRASTHAKSLIENGARAISVATDRFLYFGEDKHLSEVRNAVKSPLIRRDFLFEEYQIEESKILGADAVFLLAALLETDRLQALLKLAVSKGLDVVVEVSSEGDLKRALDAGADVVCVVGRDLDTWEPSWEKALDLLAKVPQKQCLRMVEAGIDTRDQIQHLEGLGVHGVIVGDALLDEFYPGKRLAQILAGAEPAKKPTRSKAKPSKKDSEPASSHPSSSSQTAQEGDKEFQMEQSQLPDVNPTSAAASDARKPARKADPKKAESKKPAAKKAEPKKAEPKKPAAKKAEPKKAEPKKPAAKKAEPKKAEPKKPAAKKAEPKKAEAKKPAAKNTAKK